MKRIDAHVHIVGNGFSGSGCWLSLRKVWNRVLARFMVRGVGLSASALRGDLDRLYVQQLRNYVRESALDAAVILAQDMPYDNHGCAMPEEAAFYVPNDYVIKLASRFPEFIPAASIHPGRPDALDELDKCLEAGVRVLKLLPNCLNVDYTDRRYIPFWERMGGAGMVLLSHTGGEMTVPVVNALYGDPKRLRLPLDCGVQVIAAHFAGRSGLWDPDYTDDLISMFREYPYLYSDNSALCSYNRCRTIKRALLDEVDDRVIHGSDFPVPVTGLGPWACGHLDTMELFRSFGETNPIERDYQLKLSMGFRGDSATRINRLLQWQEGSTRLAFLP